MLADAQIIGFIPVSSIETATQFYCGTLGLRMVKDDGFALVLSAAGGIMVRCAVTQGFKPQPFTVFGWEVTDINARARELAAAGIAFLRFGLDQDADGVWTSPDGSKVAWFNDPDGNVLSLSHHASERLA